MKYNYLSLGEILKQKREEKGLSKNKLAQYIGVSQPEITRIENGTRVVPNLITLINLCEILNIDFVKLLKITGFIDNKNLKMKGNKTMKKYKVTVKRIKEIDIELMAEDEENAMELVENTLDKVDVFDLEIPNLVRDLIEFETEELEDNNEKFEFDLQENSCDNCEYFCSVCGNCNYKD